MLTSEQLKEYEKLGIDPPESIDHGMTPDDLREKMVRSKCWSWRLEGNELHCETEHGHMVQTIDPAYILVGEENGLPILKKVA